jgi:hypothetical protein
LNILGKKKVLSSYQHLSVKSALRQAAKTLGTRRKNNSSNFYLCADRQNNGS